jgi:hypothetical protein
MAHVRGDRQRHREPLGHEQLVERPAIGKPQIDQRPAKSIAPLHVALDPHPRPRAQEPLGERRRLAPEALPPTEDLRRVHADQPALPGRPQHDGVPVDDPHHLVSPGTNRALCARERTAPAAAGEHERRERDQASRFAAA